jgi:uncharacterized protein YehS (DUF1456 family)
LEQEDFQTVLRAAGETETTQENIQDWLELDEGDPGFQLLIDASISHNLHSVNCVRVRVWWSKGNQLHGANVE